MGYEDEFPGGTSHATADLAGLRVLLIEDDFDTRLAFATLLETYGAEVCAVSGCDEAFAVFDTFGADAIVTDIVLCDGSGLDLVGELRRRGDTTPAVAVTGVADPHEALAAGCQAYLLKPIVARALVDTIRALVPSHRR